MAIHSRSSSLKPNAGVAVDKLDFDEHRKSPSTNDSFENSGPSGLLRDDESLLSNVVEGVIERDRQKLQLSITKYAGLASALLCCLCGGSITTFSLYAPLLLSRLRYTQFEVNAISTTAEFAQYLPIPLTGYLCDRYSPRPVSLLAAFTSGGGYLLAALVYRHGPRQEGGWSVWLMLIAFFGVGLGTCSLLTSCVTTCGKNFGKSKHKGLALAAPITALGLSGVWLSQVGGRLLTEPGSGGKRGDVDVYRYFLFLSGLAIAVGLIGAVALRIVNQEELIEEAAADQLERSGHLEDTPLLRQWMHNDAVDYSTLSQQPPSTPSQNDQKSKADALKKTLVLDGETHRFLNDRGMWFLAAGFFLISGSGEAFINNFGTMISSLYPPPSSIPPSNSPATNVSILAISSTLARIITAYLSDILAPASHPSHSQNRTFTLSRLVFLFASALLFALFELLLASSVVQRHPPFFAFVAAFAGLGYGTVFTITPILISVVWGVQNFGTNWGIIAVMPAAGAGIWGVIYSAVYQLGVYSRTEKEGRERLCYGYACYGPTTMGMFVSSIAAMVMWGWVWKSFRRAGVVV